MAEVCHGPGQERPAFEVADVFGLFGEAYRASHVLTREQEKVMRAVEACRTPLLGGHLDVCSSCGYSRPAYNSCRDRHCPKCQSLAQALWLEKRKERLLPTHYFHVVFTLPAELRTLALLNPRCLYNLLFEAAARTLLTLGRDQERLAATVGLTAVLHTWTRELAFHPHVHTIVTGGGLSLDQQRWVAVKNERYLFPVKVLSTLFRGIFLSLLCEARERDELRFEGGCAKLAEKGTFARLRDDLYRKSWVVYAKRPFGGAEQVYRYLGRYTHRVGLSNRRIENVDEGGVLFRTKDGKRILLSGEEFIRRYLLHVLPRGFVRIRHYGLLASGNIATKHARASQILGAELPRRVPSNEPPGDPRELILALTGIDLIHCPRCHTGLMSRSPVPILPGPARPPPEPWA